MLRTYKKLENEMVKVGKLSQVINNKITTRFPLLKKGIDLKPTIPTTYPVGRSTPCSINENKIITAVDNVLYLSEYKDGVFTEISTTTLLEAITVQKIIMINENKIIILYNDRTTTGCYLIDVNVNTNIITIVDRFTISSTGAGNPRIDAELISNNKLAIAYHEEINMFYSYPCFVVVRIENNSFKMLQNPVKIEQQIYMTSVLSITKINSDTFLGTYATTSARVTTAHSVIYEVSSTDLLTQVSILEHQGYYDMGDYYIKPYYLDDNKILTFEFTSAFDFNIVLRKVNKEVVTGTFTFNSISNLKGYRHTVHNFDLLRQNEDGSRDFVALNSQIVRVDKNNTKLSEIDKFDTFTRNALGIEFKKIPTTKLSDNLIVYTDTENNLKAYSYLDTDGKVLGVVKSGDGDSYIINLAGLIGDLSGVNFEAGKKVYCDSLGNLSNDDLQTYLGYGVSKNSFILRPEMIGVGEIIREGSEGYNHNNKNYLHGFIPYVNETIENGKPYYLDNLNNLTTTLTDKRIGTGLGKGLYVKRQKALTQAELDARDLATIQSILDKINLAGGEIQEDIILPTLSTEGISLIWSSSDTSVITNTGKVTRPSSINTQVTLTATLTKNTQTISKSFEYIVVALQSIPDKFSIEIIGSTSVTSGTSETYTAVVKNNGVIVDETVTWKFDNKEISALTMTSFDTKSCVISCSKFAYGMGYLDVFLDKDISITTYKSIIAAR